MKKFALGISAIAAMFAAAPASAATYMFSFSGTDFNGSGTFITDDTANADGSFLITNTTGSGVFGGTAYSFSGPNTFAGADNLLFVDNPAQLLDFNGTSFALSSMLSANLYYSTGANAYRYITTGGSVIALDSFTISQAGGPGAVPEIATWMMMILGFGLIGAGIRNRIRVSSVRFEDEMKSAYAKI